MKLIKSSVLIAVVAVLMVLLAACGEQQQSSQSSSTAPAKSSNSSGYSSDSNGGYGSSNSGSSNGGYGSNNDNSSGYGNSGNATSLIQTATAQVKGESKTILTNAQGRTLYYFTPDTATTSACTAACAQKWPPLLAPASGSPSSTSTLPGTLSAATTGNGQQVSYNGHFLYTFSGDHAAGDTNGEGVGGKWFVATPDLK